MQGYQLILVFCVLLLNACANQGNMDKKIISTDEAPAAIGPYNQAVMAGNTLYCSGQIAIDPASGELVDQDIEAETKQVMENIGAVLKKAGMDYNNIVKASIFMRSMDDYAAVNGVYKQYFDEETAPAREAVEVARLPKSVGVEISVTAVK